jgi:hypothetical protein
MLHMLGGVLGGGMGDPHGRVKRLGYIRMVLGLQTCSPVWSSEQ